MQARYYDPVIGRFYSNDPIGYSSENPVMSFNRYMYVNNNPYKYTDPDGKWLLHAIGFAVGAVTSGVSAYNDGARGGDLLMKSALGGLIGMTPAKLFSNAKALANTAKMGVQVADKMSKIQKVASIGKGGAVGGLSGVLSKGGTDLLSGKISSPKDLAEAGVKGTVAGLIGASAGLATGVSALGLTTDAVITGATDALLNTTGSKKLELNE
jgi:uncharacterized protein RhaS with RHS repeats